MENLRWVIAWLIYSPFLAIALLAQWSDRYRVVRWLTYGLTLLFDALILLTGLAAFRNTLGLIWVATALLAPVLLLPAVRRWLARPMPIDHESSIHATALALGILALGLNSSQVLLVGGLDVLAESDNQLTLLDLVLSNVPIGLFALVGVGFLIRRTPRATWERLGLERPTLRQVGLTVGLALAILVFYYGVGRIWRALDPENYQMMEALGQALYGGLANGWQAIVLSLVAAVTEELLFRGALQPRFGLPLTAILFTGAHVQYGFTPVTLEVFGGAVVLGWLRQRANTSACVFLHMLYDIAGLLVFPLLPG
jgi:membrane protease YdiL (CAAX protease family)